MSGSRCVFPATTAAAAAHPVTRRPISPRDFPSSYGVQPPGRLTLRAMRISLNSLAAVVLAAVVLTASASSPVPAPQTSDHQASPFGLFWSGDVTNLSLYSRPGA